MNFIRIRSVLSFAAACIALVIGAIASCKKSTETAAPGWFRASQYSYDFETDAFLHQDSIQLKVYNSNYYGSDEILIEQTIKDTGELQYANVIELAYARRRADGLYSTNSTYCGMGGLGSVFEYKVIPAYPANGESVQLYGCEHSDEGHNLVLNADTVITVPAGTFHTFCLQQENGDKSYWNRDVGIILYEKYQNDKAFPYVKLCTLKLRAYK